MLRRVLCLMRVVLATLLAATVAHAQDASDDNRAWDVARRQAEAGRAVAQFTLGSLLYYGATDLAQAIDWFRKAALQQYGPAEFQLGQVYEFGFGVPQDDARACDWYLKAASHGSAQAQRALADCYRKGIGMPTDLTAAVLWYRRAADADDLRAQYQLGQMYFDGTGVARDYTTAYVWFSLAASQTPLVDNRKALVELKNIADVRMGPAAAAEAAARVAQWKPSHWP